MRKQHKKQLKALKKAEQKDKLSNSLEHIYHIPNTTSASSSRANLKGKKYSQMSSAIKDYT